jgi:hypothetical protein
MFDIFSPTNFRKLLLTWIIDEFLPLSFVKSNGLKRLISMLHPQALEYLPKRTAIKSDMSRLFVEEKELLIKSLQVFYFLFFYFIN